MKAIEITAPRRARGAAPVERPDAGRRRRRAADPRRRVGRQPARRAAAQGPLPGAAGRVRHPGPRSRRRRSSSGDAQAMAAAGFKIGDRVCALVAGGGYAESASRRSASACRCPTGLSDVEAASLPETFFTVWTQRVRPRPPAAGRDACSCRAAPAASASPRSRWPRRSGATVIATAGSDDKCRGLPRRSAPTTRSTTRRRTSSPRCRRSPAARASTSSSTWSRGDYVAREIEVPGRGRPHRHHRGAGRHQGASSTPAWCCAGA